MVREVDFILTDAETWERQRVYKGFMGMVEPERTAFVTAVLGEGALHVKVRRSVGSNQGPDLGTLLAGAVHAAQKLAGDGNSLAQLDATRVVVELSAP